MKRHNSQQHNWMAWAFFALLTGPLPLLLVRFWKGIVLLSIPMVAVSIISFLFLNNDMTKLVNYPLTLEVWGAFYWIICIVTTADEVKAKNLRTEVSEEDQQFPASPVSHWLSNNPGKTINDYYKYH